MPNKVTTNNLNATSVDILNAIRNSATANYRDYVPVAESGADSVKEIGAVIMNYPSLQNEFLSALVNRIGRVIMTNKMYNNPWSMFKQGLLEFGETIEEIFVNIAKPFEFDQAVSESEVFKREIPDVRSAFHILNYKKFYKATISQDQLRQAFTAWDGITNLITKIIDSMYAGANYDEFQTMKYMVAKHILNGELYPVTIPTVTTDTMKKVVSTVKSVSNSFEFLSDEYNRAGVHTFVTKENQYLVVNSNFDAEMDVEVLASAFNMDKAEFSGHRVLVDSFGKLDIARLNELFANEDWYEEIGSDVLQALDNIPAIIVDKDWFMIFDNMYNFTEQYNGQGLYWNYFYHTWKTFSVSPFANSAVFIPGTPVVNSVKVSPEAVTVLAGQSVQLNALVETENFAPKSVVWSTDSDYAYVDIYGKVTLNESAETGQTFDVVATSTYDATKSGKCSITVGVKTIEK
jgi:hypothetical protein